MKPFASHQRMTPRRENEGEGAVESKLNSKRVVVNIRKTETSKMICRLQVADASLRLVLYPIVECQWWNRQRGLEMADAVWLSWSCEPELERAMFKRTKSLRLDPLLACLSANHAWRTGGRCSALDQDRLAQLRSPDRLLTPPPPQATPSDGSLQAPEVLLRDSTA